MDKALDLLLKDMERSNEILKTNIPILISLVRELEASKRLAWFQLEKAQQRLEDLGEL
jgi:hypothetical protein